MEKKYLNMPRSMKSASRISLSSDGSWKLSCSSGASLKSVRARYVPEISQTVAATTATDPVMMVKPVVAQSISATASDESDTDEESSDQQSTDLQSIDEPATEEEQPIVPTKDEEPSTVPVYKTCDHLPPRVRLSQKLSFKHSYGKDVYADLRSLDDGDVAYKKPVQAKVVKLQQVRASHPGGDMGIPKPKTFRCGAAANAKNLNDDKFLKRVASPDTKNNERLVTARRKPVVAQKTFKNKNSQIKNVYMSQANKVSTKPAPFQRRSSSYINRQAMQRETDRINYKIMRKLINVKAAVSTFR
ncbi:uncharacterized protein LOC111035599 [Myzus persicae]|uniref:uncharacterized protein LOC111035599 n=1 Tax=Myzus persicae TaxID=13164 RepID=UPI000B93A085|nr:uncharacterized protein LOC111035599 [Myzus persicae]